MRRRIRRLRRFNWRWTLAFTRKPPGWQTAEGVKYLNCSPKPGGFRVSGVESASNYAWLRSSAMRGTDRVLDVREDDRWPAERRPFGPHRIRFLRAEGRTPHRCKRQ